MPREKVKRTRSLITTDDSIIFENDISSPNYKKKRKRKKKNEEMDYLATIANRKNNHRLYQKKQFKSNKRTDQNLSLNINSQIDNKWYNADEQLDRILIDLPDDGWDICDRDRARLLPSFVQKSYMCRYFTQQMHCSHCKGIDHNNQSCPEVERDRKRRLRSLICFLCGDHRHLAAACTTKGCDICFEPGHLNKRCNNTIRMLQSSCTRCEQFGHTDERCPEIWRQWSATTIESSSPQKFIVHTIIREHATCFKCSRPGHFAHECNAPHAMLYHLPVLNKTINSFERLIPTKRPDLSLKSTGENRQPSRETVALFELNARFDAQIFNAYDTDDVLNSNRKSIGLMRSICQRFMTRSVRRRMLQVLVSCEGDRLLLRITELAAKFIRLQMTSLPQMNIASRLLRNFRMCDVLNDETTQQSCVKLGRDLNRIDAILYAAEMNNCQSTTVISSLDNQNTVAENENLVDEQASIEIVEEADLIDKNRDDLIEENETITKIKQIIADRIDRCLLRNSISCNARRMRTINYFCETKFYSNFSLRRLILISQSPPTADCIYERIADLVIKYVTYVDNKCKMRRPLRRIRMSDNIDETVEMASTIMHGYIDRIEVLIDELQRKLNDTKIVEQCQIKNKSSRKISTRRRRKKKTENH